MNKNLQKMTEEWKRLERMTLDQRKQAEAFYDNNLMNLIRDDYIKRNKSKVVEKVKYLVVSVGTSYEPIVLNIALFQPEKVLFLYTEQTINCLEKIVSYSGLSIASIYKNKVSETDPLSIYREIKNAYIAWNKPEKMYIDFTGGTKAMSAAAAMAGAMIDVQLVYVGTNHYLTDFRKPNPGSETLFFIDNPLSVFGDLEIEKAFILFAQYNFAGAGSKLGRLKEELPDPYIRQQLGFAWLLAKAYEAWDALEFAGAYSYMKSLFQALKRDDIHKEFLMMDMKEEIGAQLKILNELKEIPPMLTEKRNFEVLKENEKIWALMFTMYQNALTRERQGKLDMATLLFYRLLEMIEQRRLSFYGLYISDMDYSHIVYEFDYHPGYKSASPSDRFAMLKKDVQEIKKALFKKTGNGYLPEQISLLEGFIILYAFHDPVVFRSEKEGINLLKRMRSMVYLRNNSIFAHGLGPVEEDNFRKFRAFVEELFVDFCKIEDVAFYKRAVSVEWLDPMKSENYAHTMESGTWQ